MSGELGRALTVMSLSFRGSLRGLRALGLVAFAAVPSLIVLALVSAHPGAGTLSNAAEALFGSLTLPIVVMVIVLVLSVAQFRNEIDAETLVYLSDRSVSHTTIVVGKYFGALGASLLLVLPCSLAPLGIAELAGGTPYSDTVPLVLACAAVLATAAYVAIFLFFGLVSRSALMIGLLFGFLWEELLSLAPGDVPRLTLVYYLQSFLSGVLTSGPLSGYPTSVPSTLATAVVISVASISVLLAVLAFNFLETAPERESA